MISPDIPRQRILFLEDSPASEPAPLVWGRVRSALIFRRSPDGLCRRVRPQAARIIEWNPQIVAQWRLPEAAQRPWILVTRQTPFTRNIGWILRTSGLGKSRDTDQHRYGEEKPKGGNLGSIGLIHIFLCYWGNVASAFAQVNHQENAG
ncbi:MAG: hypothetical protein DMG11_32215 [Acidobacteria bacterium]|nr:MAG: hypothetical protein DMG11_32215 [Acidobacteriota bacterium]